MSPPSAVDVDAPNGNGVTSLKPLTIGGVPACRAKTQLPKGIAAFSHSDMFKSAVWIPMFTFILALLQPVNDCGIEDLVANAPFCFQ